ncbi:hypothetical protein [Algihabitans albus]|uniref:hypothetical protein n=1 Tax=Algihabitans albus TaxID=2164067 RepID=UPI000E5DA311|nr:hypothetical protein [Algihabitans albus]
MILPSQAETLKSLYAVWRLLRGDRSAVSLLEEGPEGFVKSFFAAALVLPFWLLHEWMLLSDERVAGGLPFLFAIEGLTYGISWLAFPVAMTFVAEALGRSQHYFRHIVVWNWAVVIQAAFAVPVAALAGAAEVAALGGILLLVQIAIFVYQWYLTRVALQVDSFPAVGIVLMAWVLDLLVAGVGHSMIVG